MQDLPNTDGCYLCVSLRPGEPTAHEVFSCVGSFTAARVVRPPSGPLPLSGNQVVALSSGMLCHKSR